MDKLEEITEAELQAILSSPPMSEIDQSFFPATRNLRDILIKECKLKKYQKGDIVIREGDFGTSAFIVIKGSVYYLLDKLAVKYLGRQAKRKKISVLSDFLAQFKSNSIEELRLPEQIEQIGLGKKAKTKKHSYINKVDIVLSKLRKTLLEQGEIFGEISAFGRDPRSATVVANEDTVLLEIYWQGIRDLRKLENKDVDTV